MDIHYTAIFSECRNYRYAIMREWDSSAPKVLFIGLNPSTADETTDDPTIRRCIGYAQSWGYGGLLMANLFAIRATDPKDMLSHPDPVGPLNNEWLMELSGQAGITVAAWGAHGGHRDRDEEIKKLISPLHCLAKTKQGKPRHPLYLPKHLTPVPYA